mmetsp:Transcript_46370/g.100840  ORF Transcript_46370/g.100840 Transcript_46370/m.100840 type:complete len:416 (-) Transcript_46370:11-1258(-)
MDAKVPAEILVPISSGTADGELERLDALQGDVFRLIARGPLSVVARWRQEWAALLENFLVFFASKNDLRITAVFSLSSIISAGPARSEEAATSTSLRLQLIIGGRQEEILLRTAEPTLAQRWLESIDAEVRAGRWMQLFVPSTALRSEMEERRRESSIFRDAERARERQKVQESTAQGQLLALRGWLRRVLAARFHPWLHKACRLSDARGTTLLSTSLGLIHVWRALERLLLRSMRSALRHLHCPVDEGHRVCQDAPQRARSLLILRRLLAAWWEVAGCSTRRQVGAKVALKALGSRLARRGSRSKGQPVASAYWEEVAWPAASPTRLVWAAWHRRAVTESARRVASAAERLLFLNASLLHDLESQPLELALRALQSALRRAQRRRVALAMFKLASSSILSSRSEESQSSTAEKR